MPLVSVSENLSRTRSAITDFQAEIDDLNKRAREVKDEVLRLEGCKLLLETYEQAGIEDIIPQHEQFDYFRDLTNNFTLKKDPRPPLRITGEIRHNEEHEDHHNEEHEDHHNEDQKDQHNHHHYHQESEHKVPEGCPKEMIHHLISNM